MLRIIKATPNADEAQPAPFAYRDLDDRAVSHLEAARHAAAEILAEAERQAGQLRRQVEEQAQAAAREAVERMVEERLAGQIDTLAPALGQAIDEVCQAKAEWLAHWERAALSVALAIAARVVRRELQRDEEITLSLVREALELAAGSAEVTLRLHPDDLAAIGPRVKNLAGELASLGQARIVGDQSISRGGCRLDTRHGTIDQQLEAQLARIEQELT